MIVDLLDLDLPECELVPAGNLVQRQCLANDQLRTDDPCEFQPMSKQPETQDEKNGIDGGPAGQPDPDADRAQFRPEGEPVGGR